MLGEDRISRSVFDGSPCTPLWPRDRRPCAETTIRAGAADKESADTACTHHPCPARTGRRTHRSPPSTPICERFAGRASPRWVSQREVRAFRRVKERHRNIAPSCATCARLRRAPGRPMPNSHSRTAPPRIPDTAPPPRSSTASRTARRAARTATPRDATRGSGRARPRR